MKDFNEFYKVDSYGEIWSINHRNTGNFEKLTNKPSSNGYIYLTMKINGKYKVYKAHRVVYEAWFGPIPEGYDVHHKNHKKYDNRPENLELMEKKKHQDQHADEKSKIILQFDKQGNFIYEYKSLHEAARILGLNSPGNIGSCLTGKLKTAYGYIWKYKEDMQ